MKKNAQKFCENDSLDIKENFAIKMGVIDLSLNPI